MINIKVSQNFLHNPRTVNKIVGLSNISKEDVVLEIGPGKGIITDALSKKAKHVIAIEYDKGLYNNLVEKKFENVSLYNMDFLKYNFNYNQNIKIFSNIPFNLTTEIFNKLIENYKYIDDFYLIMQEETAYRFLGNPYCMETSKSLLYKPIYEGKIIFNFIKTDFYPIPNVKIVLVHYHKKTYSDIKNNDIYTYLDFISYLYINNTSFKDATSNIFTFEQQKKIRKDLNIDWNKNITSLRYEQWIKIYNSYINYASEGSKKTVKGSYKRTISKQKSISKMHNPNKKRHIY